MRIELHRAVDYGSRRVKLRRRVGFTPHLRHATPRRILRNIKTDCIDLNLCGDEIL